MDLSSISTAIGRNNVLIGIALVLGFLFWKFILQPIANEHEPIPEVPGMESPEESPQKRKT